MSGAMIATLQGLDDLGADMFETARQFRDQVPPNTLQYRMLSGLGAVDDGSEEFMDDSESMGAEDDVMMYDSDGGSSGGDVAIFGSEGGSVDEWGQGADGDYPTVENGAVSVNGDDGTGQDTAFDQPEGDKALPDDATCDQRLPLYAQALTLRRQQNIALARGLVDYRRRLAVVLRKDAPRVAGQYYNFFMKSGVQSGLKAFFLGETPAETTKMLASFGVPLAKYNYRDATSLYFAVPVVGAETVTLPSSYQNPATCGAGTVSFTHTFTGKSVTACLTPLQVQIAQRLQQVYDLKKSGVVPTSCPSGQRLGTVLRNGITSVACVAAPATVAAGTCPATMTPRIDPATGRTIGCIPKSTATIQNAGAAPCQTGYTRYFYGPNKDQPECRPNCPPGSTPAYDMQNVFQACVPSYAQVQANSAQQNTGGLWLFDVNGNPENRQSPGNTCPAGYSTWGAGACRKNAPAAAATTPTPPATPPATGPEPNPFSNFMGLGDLGALTKGPAAIPAAASGPSYVWLRVTNRPVTLGSGRKGFYAMFATDLATVQAVTL